MLLSMELGALMAHRCYIWSWECDRNWWRQSHLNMSTLYSLMRSLSWIYLLPMLTILTNYFAVIQLTQSLLQPTLGIDIPQCFDMVDNGELLSMFYILIAQSPMDFMPHHSIGLFTKPLTWFNSKLTFILY